MIYVEAHTASEAWKQCCLELYSKGKAVSENGFYKNESAAIEILNVTSDLYNPKFPISEEQILVINNFLVTGEEEERVFHEWTKIYRERLFGENQQLNNVINYLKKTPSSKRAQVSVWENSQDLEASCAPCLQLLWFKIISNTLEIHVHMRATDCFGKLLMNINEFIALQKLVSRELNIVPGKYIHFVDSLHFYDSDKVAVDKLLESILLETH